MSALGDLRATTEARRVKLAQICIRFAGASKRYLDAAERLDVKEMLRIGLEVQGAMETMAKVASGTEVEP